MSIPYMASHNLIWVEIHNKTNWYTIIWARIAYKYLFHLVFCFKNEANKIEYNLPAVTQRLTNHWIKLKVPTQPIIIFLFEMKIEQLPWPMAYEPV